MTKTIWKFELEITDTQAVSMPDSAEILKVDRQGFQLCLWAMVRPDAAKQDRTFEIFGTGHPIHVVKARDRKYLSTVQMMDGLVWHVFERTDLANPPLVA